jgi:site-specific recombinase XerD
LKNWAKNFGSLPHAKQKETPTICEDATASFLCLEYAGHYFEVYCGVRNRRSSCLRKDASLNYIRKFLGKSRLRDVEMRNVHEFVAWRTRSGVKHATVNRDLAVLRHMFEFAVEETALKVNPVARIRKLREMRPERPRVSQQALQSILHHLAFPVDLIVIFIYETGCRPSEALVLRWDQLDLEKKTAVFNL